MFSLILAALVGGSVPSLELPIPPQFQGDNTVIVKFMSFEDIQKQCGEAEPPRVRYGCAVISQPRMYVLNPCGWEESKTQGTYAHYMCHEMAHTNGWSHD